MFPLGRIVASPGALRSCADANVNPLNLLARHMNGDWGDLSVPDKEENDFSILNGLRSLSAYNLETGGKIWIITEADRSKTAILLPEEY